MNASRRIVIFASLLALGPALSACATAPDAEYPSLALREAEYETGQYARPTGECLVEDGGPRTEGQFEPPAPPPPPPPPRTLSTDLVQRIAQLEEEARAAHADFERALPTARSTIRGAGGVGTKSWGRAEVAYANLRSIRARTAVPLAELDTLVATRSIAGDPVAPIVAARDAVAQLIEAEDAALRDLAPL